MSDDNRYRIDVSVTPRYLAAQSEPEQNRYAFAYTVTIENKGEVAAQLLSRHWSITDGDGQAAGQGRPSRRPTRRGRNCAPTHASVQAYSPIHSPVQSKIFVLL